MNTILEVELQLTTDESEWKLKHEILIPRGSQILKLKYEIDLYMWFLCDIEEPEEERVFNIYTTGQILGDVSKDEYIDSFIVRHGDFIGHVFEYKR